MTLCFTFAVQSFPLRGSYRTLHGPFLALDIQGKLLFENHPQPYTTPLGKQICICYKLEGYTSTPRDNHDIG